MGLSGSNPEFDTQNWAVESREWWLLPEILDATNGSSPMAITIFVTKRQLAVLCRTEPHPSGHDRSQRSSRKEPGGKELVLFLFRATSQKECLFIHTVQFLWQSGPNRIEPVVLGNIKMAAQHAK